MVGTVIAGAVIVGTVTRQGSLLWETYCGDLNCRYHRPNCWSYNLVNWTAIETTVIVGIIIKRGL